MDPLVFEFAVGCSTAHAFETWTTDASRWWPSDHSMSGESSMEVIFEPSSGGRIYERTSDANEHDWGEILVWEPPTTLVYLWHIGSDRSDATEVEVTFTPGNGETIVHIEHRGWERLGSSADARRTANEAGWTSLTPNYIAACN